ncbi:MAG: helix-turn-helix transcriptional regulator [Pseudomonadota bacterium]
MDIRKRVGLNLKKYRLKTGLSQEDLALKCGLHRTYVSGVERGIRNPTVTVLEKLARPLGIAASQLLEE